MKHRVLKSSKNCATIQQECNQCNCQSLRVHNGAKHFFVESMSGKYRDSPVIVQLKETAIEVMRGSLSISDRLICVLCHTF